MAFKDEIAEVARSKRDIIRDWEIERDRLFSEQVTPQKIVDCIKADIRNKAVSGDFKESSSRRTIKGIVEDIESSINIHDVESAIDSLSRREKIYPRDACIKSVEVSVEKKRSGMGILKSSNEHKFRVTFRISYRWRDILSKTARMCFEDGINVEYGIRIIFDSNDRESYLLDSLDDKVDLEYWDRECRPIARAYLRYSIVI